MNIHHITGFLSQSLGESGNQRSSSFSKKSTNTVMLTGCDFYVYPTGIFQLKGNTDEKFGMGLGLTMMHLVSPSTNNGHFNIDGLYL